MEASLSNHLGPAALLAGLYVTGVWVVSVIKRNTGIVDIFWGPGFIIIAGAVAARTDGWHGREWLVLALAAAWGVRLAAHVAVRNHGKPEDARYAAWRARHERTWWWRSYFTVFLLQGGIMLVVSLPLIAAVSAPVPDRFVVLDAVAAVIWLTGFLFEAVGDWQLLRFKRDPANKGQVMDRGLWRYSRHPNYFGETLIWWGFFGFAAAAGAYWSVAGALVITILLLRFSGVTLLEKNLVNTKPAYRDYIQRTSAFFPLPPKR